MPEIRAKIESCMAKLKPFATRTHGNDISDEAGLLKNLLLIWICCPALSQQFDTRALANLIRESSRPYYIVNMDPDGVCCVLPVISDRRVTSTTKTRIAAGMFERDDAEVVLRICEHLSSNSPRRIRWLSSMSLPNTWPQLDF